MTQEEIIIQDLIKKFPVLEGKAKIQRTRRLTAEVDGENFENVFAYAQQFLGFTVLCTITGLDEGQTLGFIYHMSRNDGITLSLKISVPKERPVIKSMIKYFPSSDIYERELIDLLGAEVKGLPKGNRYPLPDNWPKDDHPLRKDWKPKNVCAAKTTGTTEEGVKNA